MSDRLAGGTYQKLTRIETVGLMFGALFPFAVYGLLGFEIAVLATLGSIMGLQVTTP